MNGPINLGGVRYCHTQLRANLARGVDDTLTQAGQYGVQKAGAYPFKHPSGALASKNEAKVIKTRRGAVLKLRNSSPYAKAQDLGSGLHGPRHAKYPIVPRRAKFLRFVGRDGSIVITRRVMHPGVRPTRFLFLGLEAAGAYEKNLLTTEMGRIARRFNKFRA